MKTSKRRIEYLKCLVITLSSIVLFNGVPATKAMGAVEVSFLYRLSNFSGPVPFNWANIQSDDERNEIYVIGKEEGVVRVFNGSGMEVFLFGDDGRLGRIVDLAVKPDGNMLVISRNLQGNSIILTNFRGEPISELKLQNFPSEFSRVNPQRVAVRGERLYLVDMDALKIVVTDLGGDFREGYDLVSLLDMEEKKRADIELGGFSVDRQGNMFFTIPVLFLAYKLAPDGKIFAFGRPGGGPGRFGVVGGIVSDERGNLYVADRLKSVVMVFDKDFRFLKEFGYRGTGPDNLIAPKGLVLDPEGRIYVSQLRSRGISVFEIKYK